MSNIYHGHATMLSNRCLFGLASRSTRWMQCPAFVAMIRIVNLLTYQLVTQLQFVMSERCHIYACFAARIYRRHNMFCPVNKASGCLDLPLPPYPSPACTDVHAPSHRSIPTVSPLLQEIERHGRDVLLDSIFLHTLCHRPSAALASLQTFAKGNAVQVDQGGPKLL